LRMTTVSVTRLVKNGIGGEHSYRHKPS